MISSHLLPLPLSLSFGFHPSAVFPVWLRIVPCVWVTQVVRKLSRRTKGKSPGSVADVGVEKRADGCQTIVEVEEPCDFPTILHIFRDSQKTPKNRARVRESAPVSIRAERLSNGCPKELPINLQAELSSNLGANESLIDEPRVKPQIEKQGQPDSLVLYRSLVWEGVLPDAFDSEFQKFYSSVSPLAERQRQNSAHFDNVEAACWLSEHKRKAEASEKVRPHEPTLAEVVAATAGREPKTFKSRFQRSLVRHTVGKAGGRRG